MRVLGTKPRSSERAVVLFNPKPSLWSLVLNQTLHILKSSQGGKHSESHRLLRLDGDISVSQLSVGVLRLRVPAAAFTYQTYQSLPQMCPSYGVSLWKAKLEASQPVENET